MRSILIFTLVVFTFLGTNQILAAESQPAAPRTSNSSDETTMHPVTGDHAVTTSIIGNVVVPHEVTVGGETLQLNGIGVGKKWWLFKQYVIALYVPKTTRNAGRLMLEPGPKRITIHWLSNVSQRDLATLWNNAFVANSTTDTVKTTQKEMHDLLAQLQNFHKGEELTLEYIPEIGTQVLINGKSQATVAGKSDFAHAWLRIWLGRQPVDKTVKGQLLGHTIH